jgi:hypothetical protein
MPPKPGQGDAARRKAGVAAMKETQVRLSDKITFSCVLFVCLQRYAPKTKETHQEIRRVRPSSCHAQVEQTRNLCACLPGLIGGRSAADTSGKTRCSPCFCCSQGERVLRLKLLTGGRQRR